jgi:hypothetical protein
MRATDEEYRIMGVNRGAPCGMTAQGQILEKTP